MDYNRIFIKNASPTKVGGQAVLEGLMMRGSRAMAVALRKPDGGIHLTVEPVRPKGKWAKIPVLRGIVSFVSSLVTGTGTLLYSADVLESFEDEEEKESEEERVQAPEEGAERAPKEPEEKEKKKEKEEKPGFFERHFGEKKAFTLMLYGSVALSLVFVVALFILLPTWVLGFARRAGLENVILLNLLEGLIRIALFVGYVLIVRCVPDIRRTFEYHGAEHKTIHCYENGLALTPENAQQFYTLHPRCGTSFMLFVMIISLIVFSFLGWPNVLLRTLSRLALIPVVAGLSYELLQFTGRHSNLLVKILSWPGLMLQRLTTSEPDLKQLEVAIAAMKAVLPSHEDPNVPVDFWVGTVTPEGALVKDEAATAAYAEKKSK